MIYSSPATLEEESAFLGICKVCGDPWFANAPSDGELKRRIATNYGLTFKPLTHGQMANCFRSFRRFDRWAFFALEIRNGMPHILASIIAESESDLRSGYTGSVTIDAGDNFTFQPHQDKMGHIIVFKDNLPSFYLFLRPDGWKINRYGYYWDFLRNYGKGFVPNETLTKLLDLATKAGAIE